MTMSQYSVRWTPILSGAARAGADSLDVRSPVLLSLSEWLKLFMARAYHDWVKRSRSDLTHRSRQRYGVSS